MKRHRVFISYSHEEKAEYRIVRDAFRDAGMSPWADEEIDMGSGFSDEIQNLITHSHLYVPIITPISHARGWVHQETGFAVGMRIPCIPVSVGKLPDGMIQFRQAIVVDKVDETFPARISAVPFNRLVERFGESGLISGEIADEPGKRADLIAQYAKEAENKIGHQCIRHAGGLSSFSLPTRPIDSPVWTARYGIAGRVPEQYEKFRNERLALEKHARHSGCRLVINCGVNLENFYGLGVTHTRFRLLREFLESMSDDKVEIVLCNIEQLFAYHAIETEEPISSLKKDLEAKVHDKIRIVLAKAKTPQALLTVGDWFLAESAALRPVRGIRHTVFASHAPSIARRIREFDYDLEQLLNDENIPNGQSSRLYAIERIDEILQKFPRHSEWP